jgi:hypothetical protein
LAALYRRRHCLGRASSVVISNLREVTTNRERMSSATARISGKPKSTQCRLDGRLQSQVLSSIEATVIDRPSGSNRLCRRGNQLGKGVNPQGYGKARQTGRTVHDEIEHMSVRKGMKRERGEQRRELSFILLESGGRTAQAPSPIGRPLNQGAKHYK